MSLLINVGRVRSHTWRIVAFCTVILTAGLALWADVPGSKPDRKVRVISFKPQGQTHPVVNITIKFSNSLVSPDSLMRPAAVIPVQITPDVEGLARWTATDELTIYPGKPLNPATEYRATVRADDGFVNGNAIERNQVFTFRTSPLSARVLNYHAQRSRGDRLKGRLVIDLDFNYPVSRKQLKKSLRVKGVADPAKSRLLVIWPDTAAGGTSLAASSNRFRLSTELFDLQDEEQRYKLVIKKDLNCVNCGNGLAVDYTYTMAVPKNPRLDLIVEQITAERPGKQGTILLRFSSRVPTDEVREHVSIDPPVSFSVETRWRGVRIRGDFKPGATYTISVSSGIISTNGELMEREFSSRVIMGDMIPSIRFTSRGLYLPRDGNRLLEINTVNIDTVSIEVSQVFTNNLVTYMATGSDRRGRSMSIHSPYGRGTFVKDFSLVSQKNKELKTTIDIGAILGDTLQGVFVVSARNRTSRWVSDSRHVLMTDIGVMTRMSDRYLLVWANSLSETKPVKKAMVKLFSRNNQLLLEGRTNSKGVAIFSDIADQIEGYRPFLITVEKDGDLSYLRLDNSRLSTSDFDVSGRPYLSKGYEAFVYFDRGVFRPGETAHLVSLVRGKNGALPGSFPYRLKIVGPRGRVFRDYRLTADPAMASIDINLPNDIPTGRYKASALLSDNYVLGQSEFLVEDFVPDRINVEVQTDRTDYTAGDTMTITVIGRMLYGAPAGNLKVSSEIVLSPEKFSPADYNSYSFSVPGKKSSIKRVTLGETVLSDSGTTTLQHIIAKGNRPPGLLSAQIWATVSEAGGRTVSSFVEAKVYPYRRFVGIRTNLGGYAKTGEPVSADIVVILPDGSVSESDSIQVSFSRMVYNSMLKKLPDGSYHFVSEVDVEPIDSLWLRVGPKKSTVSFTPTGYGRYRITARDAISGHAAALEFFATGWGRVPWSMEKPDRLQLDLDHSEYSPGTRAKLQVRAPFSGRLLITIENQTVQDYLVIDLPENTGEIELPVERSYAPNVYISATLIRPANQISKGTPARAYGMIPLKVRSDERRLDVSVICPSEIRPNSKLTVDVTTTGSDGTQLTVAAVDAGILQLTDFSTPDPFKFFYGKRRPSLTGYDLYSLIYPETDRAGSHLSPPGGVSGFRSRRHLNPFQARRVIVVALWSGIVDADSAGSFKVILDVPQFNGQLRIMAVASDGDRFGSGAANLIVREPIILQESFPRFIAPNDEVRGLVTVFNGLDSSATITVEADISGQAWLLRAEPQSIRLESGHQGVVEFPFKGLSVPGRIDVNLRARADMEETHVSFELSNRPALPLTTRFGSGTVTGDVSAIFTIPDEFVDGTAEYVLRTSSITALQMTRNIEYLLRYPYGCVEQTTSALFPLLYFNDLAKVVRPELFGGEGHEYFIAEGIDKLLRFQRSDGAFTYWPGSKRIHNWSSIYASHFLVEARLAGHEVASKGYKRALHSLKDMARDKNYTDVNTEQRIYACLVLAKAGELDRKLFNFLSGISTTELPGYSAYQLASALALAGDVERAKEIVPFDIQPDLTEPESGGNFSSGVRSDAILLDLLLEIDPENPSAVVLARSLLERGRLNRWYNTQSTAFALMSLGKYFNRVEPTAFTGEITIMGETNHRIDTSDFVTTDSALGGKQISISIEGKGPCFYFWQASGVPISSEDSEYDRGIIIRREFLDAKGSPANISSIMLGAQLVGHISIESPNRSVDNVVIADLLPAAFEVENPRLAGSPLMPWLPKNTTKAEYQDIRDDRILLFVHLPKNKTLHFYYGLRAIAAGDFVIPPVAAECMYNPLIAGAGSSGRLTVNNPETE